MDCCCCCCCGACCCLQVDASITVRGVVGLMGEGVYKRQFMEKVDIKVQKEKKGDGS